MRRQQEIKYAKALRWERKCVPGMESSMAEVLQMRTWHEMRLGRWAGGILMHSFLVMVKKLEREKA